MIGSTNAITINGGGSEAQLYDTKILSQANADNGWLYTCSDVYRSFGSSTLPTLYSDIMAKYAIASQGLTYSDAYVITDRAPNNPAYITNENSIVNSFANTNIENFADDNNMSKFAHYSSMMWNVIGSYNNYYDLYYYQGYGVWASATDTYSKLPPIAAVVPSYNDSVMICIGYDYSVYQLSGGYRCDKLSDYASDIVNNSYTISDIIKKEYDNKMYLIAHGGSYTIYATSNNDSVYDLFESYSFGYKISDLVYVNNYWYLLTTGSKIRIYKGTDLSVYNLDDTQNWQLIYESDNIYASTGDFSPRIFYSKGRFVICGGIENPEDRSDILMNYFYTDDDFNTTSNIIQTNFSIGLWNVYFEKDVLICGNNFCYLFKLNNINNWVNIELPDNTTLMDVSQPVEQATHYGYAVYVYFTLRVNASRYDIYQIQLPEPINSSTNVNIQYKKYENFKFSTYNDLHILNSVYDTYGVSNYWNIYNNQIFIPVNKQEYSVMYVDDNFQDNLYNNQ